MAFITPYLQFAGQAREAMNFYRKALGGELYLDTYGNSPMAAQLAPETHDQVLHAALVNDKLTLYASDIMEGRDDLQHGTNLSLTLNCTSQEEIDGCFARLAEGGKVVMPLDTAFWGAVFGQVQYKYGYRWMLHYDKNRQM